MNNFYFLEKKTSALTVFFVTITGLLYLNFAYYLQRSEWLLAILLYSCLCTLSICIYKKHKHNIKLLLGISLIFRILFILATPNLSQDFFRFIWDGRLIISGVNPYLHLPDTIINQGNFSVNQATELVKGMGTLSASHYSNYPPLSQFCFFLAAMGAKMSILKAIIILRLLIILADYGTYYFGRKLLVNLKLPEHQIFLYILNPFIIIELTGNLHFEAVMIFFLTLSFYHLHKDKWQKSLVFFALSVATKLIPLLFLPFIWKYLNFKKGLLYSLGVALINLALFLPFTAKPFLKNYVDTIALWFNNFEFNASIFYIIKSIGYGLTDKNLIKITGPILGVVFIICTITLLMKKQLNSFKEFTKVIVLVLSVYFFLATTVHPWYISTLVILSIFTPYCFPLIWSLVIILSYTAYASPNVKENLWLVALEYIVVYSVFIYEVLLQKQFSYKQINHFYQN